MGAFITMNGQVIQYFATAVTKSDCEYLGLDWSEGSENQQAFEALCMLVSLCTWSHIWKETRCIIEVRSDNMATLSMVTKIQPKSPSLGVIARELALDISRAIYEASVASHIAGVANVTSDMLSCTFQPGHQFELPAACSTAQEMFPPTRDRNWWRSLTLPTFGHVGTGGAKKKQRMSYMP